MRDASASTNRNFLLRPILLVTNILEQIVFRISYTIFADYHIRPDKIFWSLVFFIVLFFLKVDSFKVVFSSEIENFYIRHVGDPHFSELLANILFHAGAETLTGFCFAGRKDSNLLFVLTYTI